MSVIFLNTEAAAFDYVQTAIKTEIPDLTSQEKLVFDSLAKFGASAESKRFNLPEDLAMWLFEDYQKASSTSSEYKPTTKIEAERLELANNLRFIAGKLERGDYLPNKSNLTEFPSELRRGNLEKSFFGQESTSSIFIGGDIEETRLRKFAEFLEEGQVYSHGVREHLSEVKPVEGSLGQQRSLAVASNLTSYILLQKVKSERGENIEPVKVEVIDTNRRKAIELVGNNKEAVLEFGDPRYSQRASLKMWSKDTDNLVVNLAYYQKTKVWSAHDGEGNKLRNED